MVSHRLQLLAYQARLQEGEEHPSDRQITAENHFFDVLETEHPKIFTLDLFDEWTVRKLTSDEMIDEALALVAMIA